MVRSFGRGIPGTRNVYIFVPSMSTPRFVLLVIPSRNAVLLVRYLNRFYLYILTKR